MRYYNIQGSHSGKQKLTSGSGSMQKIIHVLTFKTTTQLVQLVTLTDRIQTRKLRMKERKTCNEHRCSFLFSFPISLKKWSESSDL